MVASLDITSLSDDAFSPISPLRAAAAAQNMAQNMADFAGFRVTATRSLEDFEAGRIEMKKVPGLGEKVAIDDFDATVVFVLPKLSCGKPDETSETDQDDDSSDSDVTALTYAYKEHPDAAVRSVFCHQHDIRDLGVLSGEEMPFHDFQRVLRRQLHRVITATCGMQLSSFMSVDRDVVFWKIAASQSHLKRLAEKYAYLMPYSEHAYEEVGMKPPMSRTGVVLPAYAHFTVACSGDFQPFRSIDAIRLVMMELQAHLNIHELESQGAIARWFPAAKYREMKALTDEVVGWPIGEKFRHVPEHGDIDLIRAYFGEEVAIFFSFYRTYLHRLLIPFVFAMLVCFLEWCKPVPMGLTAVHSTYAVFGIGMIFWGINVVVGAEKVVFRERWRWGVNGSTIAEVQIKGYERKERGSGKQQWYAYGGKIITLAFMWIVMATCSLLPFFIKVFQTTVQTAVTFAFSFLWGKIARQIVALENHRTQARFNEALTMRLTFVKLFVFVFPMMRLAFLAPLAQRRCGEPDNMSELFYNSSNHNLRTLLPDKQTDSKCITKDSKYFKEWLESRRFKVDTFIDRAFLYIVDLDQILADAGEREERTISNKCYPGCFPVECELVVSHTGDQRLRCLDTCGELLKRSLNSLFFFHNVFAVAFVVVPMFRVRWAAKAELAQASRDQDGSLVEPYTLIQYQEKCHQVASYEYESWGGSYVEDFLELVLGFAVLVCFSTVSPGMSIVAFISQLFEFRLLAYRMTWVTCRPFPAGSEGMGEWLKILDSIIYLAIGMNSLLLVTVLRSDLDDFSTMEKFLIVLCLIIFFIGLNVCLRLNMHEQPWDIVEAVDHNHDFVEALRLCRHAPRCQHAEVAKLPDNAILGVGDE
mmetsp:Transcript_120167/g.347240  ORF Transcript_120167/g.347240 Transcript_120167/m.347240 type:complete len:870 (+) Transcript_120167:60-2669(+)